MKRKRNDNKASAKGFDLGTPADQVHVPDADWTRDLSAAGIVGCAYGVQDVAEIGPIPSISLVASDELRIREAFATFGGWTRTSDDDALEVTIVFLVSGGYLLGISPDFDRLAAEAPVCAMLDPVRILQAWVKPMDTTDRHLRSLRDYARQLVAPIAFGAVLRPDASIPSPEHLRPIPGLRTFVKFGFTFVHEEDDDKPLHAEMLLRLNASGRNGRPMSPVPRPSRITPGDWAAKRRRVMREVFPLTLFRARSGGLVERVKAEFQKDGCADWQVEQAVCNVALSRALDADCPHFGTTPRSRLLERVVEVVQERREIYSGAAECASFPVGEVAAQLALDARFLVAAVGGGGRDGSFPALQAALRRGGYLAVE